MPVPDPKGSLLKKRLASLPLLAALAFAGPAVAQTPVLESDRSCYGPGQEVGLTGIGFTPGAPVAVSVDGRQLGSTQANPVGEFDISLSAPSISAKQRRYAFSATEEDNPAVTASASFLVSSLAVKITPRGRTNPGVMRRIVARGFTSGRVLWAHIKRGKRKARNVKIGRLKGACHTINVKRRLFPSNATPGVYKVQFDTKRRYSKKTRPNTTFSWLIFRTLRASSASAPTATAAAVVRDWTPLG
ncbi:MAG: hypothetical protein GXY03_11445 [Solirubrobacterales bacterium]|nr:hypothetical protein [Solirubrobacterales bacterium]